MEYDSGNEIENTDYNKGGNQFYEKLIGLIHDNISNSEFGITNICEELNISRTQLYRKVKAVTDIPISTLIRNLRMEKAYELFKNNDYTVSEVMYQVGINSNSYFTKTFKEYFNILPSEFIKQTYKNKIIIIINQGMQKKAFLILFLMLFPYINSYGERISKQSTPLSERRFLSNPDKLRNK